MAFKVRVEVSNVKCNLSSQVSPSFNISLKDYNRSKMLILPNNNYNLNILESEPD